MLVYDGYSKLDNETRIIAVATPHSDNVKTGDMIQTWIMLADQNPLDTSKQGKDNAICGQCPHRRSLGGACYVVLFQGPRAVWQKWNKGGYSKKFTTHGRAVRLGAYGDPYAIPIQFWNSLLSNARKWTGYTHQWKREDAKEYSSICMASVDNLQEKNDANALGWRTFRVTSDLTTIQPDEIRCPVDAGKFTNCERCGLCNGNGSRAKNIVVLVHGAVQKNFKEIAETGV